MRASSEVKLHRSIRRDSFFSWDGKDWTNTDRVTHSQVTWSEALAAGWVREDGSYVHPRLFPSWYVKEYGRCHTD